MPKIYFRMLENKTPIEGHRALLHAANFVTSHQKESKVSDHLSHSWGGLGRFLGSQ